MNRLLRRIRRLWCSHAMTAYPKGREKCRDCGLIRPRPDATPAPSPAIWESEMNKDRTAKEDLR